MDKTISQMVLENIVAHLSHLKNPHEKVLPLDLTFPEWIQQPFLAEMSDADGLKKEFTYLQESQVFKTKFRGSSLSYFWRDRLHIIIGCISWTGEGSAADDHFIPNYLPVKEDILDNAVNQHNCQEPSSWRPATRHERGSGKHDATVRKTSCT